MNSWDIIKRNILGQRSPDGVSGRVLLIQASKLFDSLRENLKDSAESALAMREDSDMAEAVRSFKVDLRHRVVGR